MSSVASSGRFGSCAQVGALTLPAEEAEEFDRFGIGGAEPMWHPGVEFGRFAGREYQIVFAQDEP